MGCPSPDRANLLLSSLTKFVNLLAAGQAPAFVTPFLCGASLLASRKKSGGHRPIAVGETLKRLVSKCLATLSRRAALSLLSTLQLGVGIRGGSEAVVHAVNRLLSSTPDTGHCTLLLDFSNAFNSINREAMFREFHQHLPGLSAWMESSYSSLPLLFMGPESIRSCCGVQQGDPLGPLGFALTLHPLIEHIKEELPALSLNAWYLDDGTLTGPPECLARALAIIEKDGPPLGLHLNRGKSLLHTPVGYDSSSSPLPPDIPFTSGGFCLLGSPIGPPAFCEQVLQERVSKIRKSLEVLSDMGDSHMQTTLLRSCLSLPKFAYSLRTCAPSLTSAPAAAFDTAVRECLESIVGGPVSEWSWLKASLPSSRGGVNLRSAELHAPAAFVASSCASQGLVGQILDLPRGTPPRLLSAVSDLSVAADRPDWQQLEDIDVPIRQNHLSFAIDEAVHHRLLSSAPSIRARALAHSSALPHAGDWLNGIPSAALGLHLQDQEFRFCLRYWLGTPLHSGSYPCPECHSIADEFGDHQVGCGGGGDRIMRHNSIRDVIFSAAQSAALAPTREAPGVIPVSLSRPADVLLPTWSYGRPAALDVHVISPLQQQTINAAASTPGHALQVGVQRKLTAHLSACRSAGVVFVPVVAESLGGLAEDTISTIARLGKGIASRIRDFDSSNPTRQLFHRLAIALWSGNASLWLHRQPPLPPAVDGIP